MRRRILPAAGVALLVAALPWRGEAAGAPALRAEAGATASLVVGGATNTYLRPGPQRPDATLLVSPRPFLGLRGDDLALQLTYAPAFQWSLASAVSGRFHDARFHMGWRASPALVVDGLLMGSLARYAGEGVPMEEGTLDLVATEAASVGGGAGLRWSPDGPLGARGALFVTRRHSRAVLHAGEPPEPVDDLRVEGALFATWRLVPTVSIHAGPLGEMRHAGRARLSYQGLGAELGGVSEAWRGGGLDASLRVQWNAFGGSTPRHDLFARLRLAAWQEIGDHVRLTLRYAYTANGSVLAAHDADRHLLVAVLALRTPTWRR